MDVLYQGEEAYMIIWSVNSPDFGGQVVAISIGKTMDGYWELGWSMGISGSWSKRQGLAKVRWIVFRNGQG